MSVRELRRLADSNQDKTVRIYNPDTEDFTCEFHGEPHTIRALDIQEFPYPIAKHLRKHLADRLLFKRGIGDKAVEDLLEEIYKEIDVEI